ncbi:metallophosphoesterase [Halorussus halophilus]|uniref:metallophosphoesterase n=1 Tax=Halorussus halophilus TaxID=2650975 RepID=UPI0013018A8B|nr:metallophosphoesterase [Halorussus halophilus]
MYGQFRDRALYLPQRDALVVADLHVGRDATSPVELSLGERADLTERLSVLLEAFDPETVVFAGDVLHAFDRVPAGVEETLRGLRAVVEESGAELVVVEGNHDSMLDGVGITARESCSLGGGTVVVHGHERVEMEADCYVVGHDHPTIEIEGTRRPCLLYGPGAYRGADVLMLPAFNRLAPGVVVNRMSGRDFQSPLVNRVGEFCPVVWDSERSEMLSFPPLGKFRKML